MDRIRSIDLFRFIAIFLVICLHTDPFCGGYADDSPIYRYLSLLIDQGMRFAIPFFCIISGYFWGQKINAGKPVFDISFKMGKRLGLLFLAWSLIYLLPYDFSAFYHQGLLGPLKIVGTRINHLVQYPFIMILEGTKFHLWFFVSLLISMGISAVFLKYKQVKMLIAFSIIFYVFGVLARAYINTPIGIVFDFDTRNGPFFCTLPFVTGFVLSGIIPKNQWLYLGFGILSIGILIHISEILIIWKWYQTSPRQEYVLGTYFYGFGVSLIALSNHPKLQSNFFSGIGRFTLGIYGIHYIFVEIFWSLFRYLNSPFWDIVFILLVLLLSVLSVFALSKNRWTKKLVV